MSRTATVGRRIAVVLLVVTTVLATLSGVAAAETRAGGQVVIRADETVSDVEAYAGSVVVRGTVDGDLTAFAGNVIVEAGGRVTGDVEAIAGNVQIDGTVQGALQASGGNVLVGPTASIGGPVEIAAGSITVAGSLDGNAKLAGGSITLGPSARVDGDVEYSIDEQGTFDATTAAVNGSITEREELSIGGGGFEGPDLGGPVFGVYGFLVNLLVGALLLIVFPRTSESVATLVEEEPLRTGGIGVLALLGVPVGLVIVAITIVGIPLSLAGIVAYTLSVWIATIYGRYALGSAVLGYTDVENRWVALLVGLVVVAVLARIPLLGGVAELVVLLLGLGAMATLLYRFVERQRDVGEA